MRSRCRRPFFGRSWNKYYFGRRVDRRTFTKPAEEFTALNPTIFKDVDGVDPYFSCSLPRGATVALETLDLSV